MSLHSFLRPGAAPAPAKRITIRRRLLGRGGRLPAVGMAAGLLSLGLASVQPAHAGTATWHGPTIVTDWYSQPSFWTGGSLISSGFDYPGSGDDAVNSAFNAPMTLGADATVNSFFSNSAFTLNGGTFSGSQANAASLLTVNNLFTVNGGTISNFTVNGTQQSGGPAASVLFTTNGNNSLSNTIVNANLDLSAGSAYVRLFNTNTVNGAISLGAGGGNGLHLYNNAANLVINGGLTGFGSVVEDNGGSTVTNNGLINANSAGNTLVTGVSNLNNNNTLEATSGGALNLSNTFTNNSGAVKAIGAGSVVTLTNGTTFTGSGSAASGNLITASGGGKVVVDGVNLYGTINTAASTALIFTTNGNNRLDNTTVNGNLDLATNNNAYLRLFDTDTINGAISLGAGGGNGLHLYNNAANLVINGGLTGFGSVIEDNGGSTVTNNGLINANSAGNTLVTGVSNLNNNVGATLKATSGGVLNLSNTTTTNYGAVAATGGGVINLTPGTTFIGNAGSTINTVGGTFNVQGATLLGTLNGAGASSLVFNTDGRNAFNGTTANINLDLATIPNAYLRLFNMDTINGAINLGESTSGNGLHLYNNATNLVISSTGNLSGFGYVVEDNGGSTVTNNGTINANSSANTLVTGVSNFNNNVGATLKATSGGVLNLSNTTTTNYGAVAATGGGVINLTPGTTFIGNAGSTINTVGGTFNVQGATLLGTLNGAGASSLVFNTDGRNAFDNTTANINLDLATNSNAYLRLFDTNTVNGAITLGEGPSSDGLHLYNNAANLVINGGLTGFGFVTEDNGGSTVTNNSTINSNSAAGLTLGVTNFINSAGATTEATSGGALGLSNTFTTNSGALKSIGAGSLVTLTNATTFTGMGTAAQGNLITASGGGKVVVDGVNLYGTINTAASTALIFTTNGNNRLDNTTVNGNLDLATNNNAYLRLFDTNTINGAISLGEGPSSDGLHLFNNAANLVINNSLTGFGSVIEDNGGSTVTNNGLINANSAGNTLVTGVSNLNNNNTLAATGGGVLNLSNTFTTNYGALNATGAGSLVTLTNATTFTGMGTAAQGNLITASGGGKVVVDGVNLRGTINTAASTALIFTTNGNNNLDNTTVNGNLDLATNNNAYVRLFDTDTINGAISLGEGPASDGLHLYNNAANLVIGSTGTLQGFGYVTEDNGGSTVTNKGTISANTSGQTLNINTSNFNNTGTATAASGATLSVTSNTTNSGTVSTQVGGTETFSQGLTQTAGLTQVFGVLNASETLNGGTLAGAKTINGNIINNGGIVQPVVGGPGFAALNINGNFSQGSGGELDAFFGNNFHNLLIVSGQTTTGGTLGVFDLDQTQFTGTGSTGSQFAFLDYSGTLTPDGSTVNGFTQYFTNEIPDSNNSGTILGQNGFKYELFNDTANKQLDLTVARAGSPVPEASTTVSLGLLLALGLGGMVIAAKRKKSA